MFLVSQTPHTTPSTTLYPNILVFCYYGGENKSWTSWNTYIVPSDHRIIAHPSQVKNQ
ncbi:hypothetical protein BDP81DRAFT_413999 [Colletotrichum phormii]|uniref:Uncharacterized protein n=1 Tax=Colletotrichum phormii TaxID=359342 RepID=A0AAJ0A3X5_9PEZI|nr:uncharacterized protein BDP81DRAFT_413999 [Colletotrichum phormii]KAK1656022.1 hypothetical protein BDP81DRAFT_413999 [Colletotrichum phormii]